MTRLLTMAMLGLPLAACGSQPAQPTNAAENTAASADDYVTRIRALSPGQRGGVLFRAIRDANRDCQHVTKSTAIADVGGAPAWSAKCDSGETWVVALNPGGVATVTGAADHGGTTQ